jgi:hypothetical protein
MADERERIHPARHWGARLRHRIQALGPYQSLLLLCVPTCLVEPAKLIALAVVGEGHWITGTAMIVAAYATSFFLVERLFRIVLPKLLKLHWFARLWTWVLAVKSKVMKSSNPGPSL